MMNEQLTYDIAIPVLNEEQRLPVGVAELYGYLQELGLKHFAITIADNGSVDKTELVARALTITYPNVRYLKVGKRGVGLALKKAWDESDADVVGYMDVDLATDIQHFAEVVRLFEEWHARSVNGSRNMHASKVTNRSLIRTVTSLGFNAVLRLALGVHFSDGMCGFKFLRRDLYRQLRQIGLANDGWFFCTEMLFVTEKAGVRIDEIPVSWTDDRNSRVKLVNLAIYYLLEIVKLRRRKISLLEKAAV